MKEYDETVANEFDQCAMTIWLLPLIHIISSFGLDKNKLFMEEDVDFHLKKLPQ